jgi:phospholipid-translocating ATPase
MQAQLATDFFLLLAVCNTVIVAKRPHHDNMNASGIVYPASSTSNSTKVEMDPTPNATNAQPLEEEQEPASDLENEVGQRHQHPRQSSLPAIAAPPLLSEPTLTPKRPTRLWDFLPSRQLSPIASSPDESRLESPPHASDASPSHPRPKHLQLPSLLTPLSRLMNQSTASLLSRHGSRSATPSPSVGPDLPKPLYEAESPDELALVDAAYAYHCKLLKRTPTKVSVSQ